MQVECFMEYIIRTYSDSQKHESSCLLNDRFWCISPEPIELHKIFLSLLGSIFKELSDRKKISNRSTNSPDFVKNTDFFKEKVSY